MDDKQFISPLAVVDPRAKLGKNVVVEPFAVIEGNTVIGDGTHVHNGAVIKSGARIGKECRIHSYAILSDVPQDLKFRGEETTLEVGDRTTIREFATIHRGTASKGVTRIGSDCLIMAYVHVAHDCTLGNHIILGNTTQLAGEVQVDDYANVSGGVLVHQFVRLSRYIMVQGGSRINKDIPPYSLVGRDPIIFCGINYVGLRRNGFTDEQIFIINEIYRLLYQSGLNTSEALRKIESIYPASTERDQILSFVRSSERGVVRGGME